MIKFQGRKEFPILLIIAAYLFQPSNLRQIFKMIFVLKNMYAVSVTNPALLISPIQILNRTLHPKI